MPFMGQRVAEEMSKYILSAIHQRLPAKAVSPILGLALTKKTISLLNKKLNWTIISGKPRRGDQGGRVWESCYGYQVQHRWACSLIPIGGAPLVINLPGFRLMGGFWSEFLCPPYPSFCRTIRWCDNWGPDLSLIKSWIEFYGGLIWEVQARTGTCTKWSH